MAYCLVAMVTDMDAWSDIPHVNTNAVLQVLKANSEKAQIYPPAIIEALRDCPFEDVAHNALCHALVTHPEHMSVELKEKLAPILAEHYPQYAPKQH